MYSYPPIILGKLVVSLINILIKVHKRVLENLFLCHHFREQPGPYEMSTLAAGCRLSIVNCPPPRVIHSARCPVA
jgi:hypothetical protein